MAEMNTSVRSRGSILPDSMFRPRSQALIVSQFSLIYLTPSITFPNLDNTLEAKTPWHHKLALRI